ncbi:MAG: alpha/beta fold hydrolase [Chloroflexota bacterium]|nr:alpha/beta fold hydrolase [Chloroflexota bacterium]
MRRILLLIGFVVALVGCGGRQQPSATPWATGTAVLAPTATSIPAAAPTPSPTATRRSTPTVSPTPTDTPSPTPTPIHPLSIEYLRQQSYPGSRLVIEETLAPGSNYDRYIASYASERLKQYGLLTVPRGQKPENGWPVIVFNHGYIAPSKYRTTERYVAYVDGFASNGYIVFRPDYRGHDRSEGRPSGAYNSPAYVIDVLNAVASLKQFPDADRQRIGMWGHSMGGWITLRSMVTTDDIKAGVIWGGVVGAYEDLLLSWRRGPTPTIDPNSLRGRSRFRWLGPYGSPQSNPEFWQAISANHFLDDLSGPIQLHHARGDKSVPVEFSEHLYEQGQEAGMPVELFTYAGDNHNISGNFAAAMARSLQFFDKVLDAPIAWADTDQPTVFSGGGPVNVRSGPGIGFEVVGRMESNESLPILGRNEDASWWQVEIETGPAWVAASVTIAAHFARVPVVGGAAG